MEYDQVQRQVLDNWRQKSSAEAMRETIKKFQIVKRQWRRKRGRKSKWNMHMKCCISQLQTCSLLDISILWMFASQNEHAGSIWYKICTYTSVTYESFPNFPISKLTCKKREASQIQLVAVLGNTFPEHSEHKLVIMQIHGEADNFTQKSSRSLKLSVICSYCCA